MDTIASSMLQKVQLTDKPFETLRQSLIKETNNAFFDVLQHTPPDHVYQRHDVIRINSQNAPVTASSQTFYVTHTNCIDLSSLRFEVEIQITVPAASVGKFAVVNNFFDSIFERWSYKMGYNTLEIDHIGNFNNEWRAIYPALFGTHLDDDTSLPLIGHSTNTTKIGIDGTTLDINFSPPFNTTTGVLTPPSATTDESPDYKRTAAILGPYIASSGTFTIYGYIKPTNLLFQLHKVWTPYTPMYIEGYFIKNFQELFYVNPAATVDPPVVKPSANVTKVTLVFDSYELDMKYFKTGGSALSSFKSGIPTKVDLYKEPVALYESLDTRCYKYAIQPGFTGVLNIQFNVTLPKAILFTTFTKDPNSRLLIWNGGNGAGNPYLIKSYDVRVNGISTTNGPINNTYNPTPNTYDIEKFQRFKLALKQNWLGFDLDGPIYNDWHFNRLYVETINPSYDLDITTPTDVGDITIEYQFEPTAFNQNNTILTTSYWFVVFIYEQKYMIDNTRECTATLPGA